MAKGYCEKHYTCFLKYGDPKGKPRIKTHEWKPPIKIAAYIAGFVDGEGYIGIDRTRSGDSFRYTAVIAITNTNQAVLQFIAAQFRRGGVYCSHTVDPETNRKPRFMFRASAVLAWSFVEPLLPYLRIKKEQAQLIISFQRLTRLEKANMQLKDHYYQTSKRLNAKGVRPM